MYLKETRKMLPGHIRASSKIIPVCDNLSTVSLGERVSDAPRRFAHNLRELFKLPAMRIIRNDVILHASHEVVPQSPLADINKMIYLVGKNNATVTRREWGSRNEL